MDIKNLADRNAYAWGVLAKFPTSGSPDGGMEELYRMSIDMDDSAAIGELAGMIAADIENMSDDKAIRMVMRHCHSLAGVYMASLYSNDVFARAVLQTTVRSAAGEVGLGEAIKSMDLMGAEEVSRIARDGNEFQAAAVKAVASGRIGNPVMLLVYAAAKMIEHVTGRDVTPAAISILNEDACGCRGGCECSGDCGDQCSCE